MDHNTTPSTEEQRTFSQEDVNRIVQERLARERASIAEREQEIMRKELMSAASERLTGWKFGPKAQSKLLGVVDTSSKEAMERDMRIIEFFKPEIVTIGCDAATPPMHQRIDDTDQQVREAMNIKR